MSKRHEFYSCERCGVWYSTRDLAESCEAQVDPVAVAAAGEVVVVRAGWADDLSWVRPPDNAVPDPKHGNCFGECCRQFPYWVVGLVEVERVDEGLHAARYYPRDVRDEVRLHRLKYHLGTRAQGEALHAYTYDRNHYEPRVVSPRPRLRGAKALVGVRAKHLL